MFKIKKSSKRAIGRDPLLEANQNYSSQLVRSVRPQSVRLPKKNITSQQVIPRLEKDVSQEFMSQTGQSKDNTTCRYPLMLNRQVVEEEIRRLSAIIFKDQISRFGEFKEEVIKKVSEKCLLRPEIWSQNRQEELMRMLTTQIERLQKAKEVRKRCQQRQSRIETMISQRLARLSAMR